MNPATARARGFTLVELLLAVTLMSLLMALAYGGFRAAGKASERGQVLLEQSGEMRIVQTFIRRQFNQMLPLEFDPDGEDGDLPVKFLGDSHAVQFVAPMPGYLGSGGPQVQRVEVVQGDDGLVLQFSHALYEGFETGYLYERDPIVLLDRLPYAQFEFLGLDETGEGLMWTSTWEDGSLLPKAVRLDVEMPEGSQVHWPVLMTGVRVDEAAVSQQGDVVEYREAVRRMIRDNREGEQ